MASATVSLTSDPLATEQLLRTVLDVSLVGTLLLKPIAAAAELPDFRYHYCNAAALRQLRLPAPPTGTLRELYPEAVALGVLAFFQAAYQHHAMQTLDLPYCGKPLHAAYKLAAQRSGELLVVSLADVTEFELAASQQVEAARAETERQRLRWVQLFERAPAAISIFSGPEWRYEFINPAYQALFPGRTLAGRPLLEALPELRGTRLEQIFQRVYDAGEAYERTEELVHLVGTENELPRAYYFDLTYQPLYGEQDRINGFVTYATDATERVLARRERERQQLLLQQVLEQGSVGVYVLRMPYYVLEVVNQPMARVLGRPVEELRGRPLFTAVPKAAYQGLAEMLDRVWRTRQPLHLREQPFRLAHHRPGEVGYYSYVYQPILDAQGQVTALVCIMQDVTEQVLAHRQVQALNEELAATNEEMQNTNQELAVLNEELRATNDELHESNTQLTRTNADLDTFVYTASHDLKAPITNVEGLLSALRETLPQPVQQEADTRYLLELLDTTVGRFRQTITQLTDLIRLQQSHQGPAEPVSLRRLLAELQQDLAPVIAEASAELQVEIPPGLRVTFAPANLRSIIYNLLSNAVKYRDYRRSAQVWVWAEQQPRSVVLHVRDNGLGLTGVQQQRLFQVFQRLHTHVEGTGVGLYMIKRLIDNAGARIAVASEPGVGSTITVTFPT